MFVYRAKSALISAVYAFFVTMSWAVGVLGAASVVLKVLTECCRWPYD